MLLKKQIGGVPSKQTNPSDFKCPGNQHALWPIFILPTCLLWCLRPLALRRRGGPAGLKGCSLEEFILQIWAVLRSAAKRFTYSGLNGNPHKALTGWLGAAQECDGPLELKIHEVDQPNFDGFGLSSEEDSGLERVREQPRGYLKHGEHWDFQNAAGTCSLLCCETNVRDTGIIGHGSFSHALRIARKEYHRVTPCRSQEGADDGRLCLKRHTFSQRGR